MHLEATCEPLEQHNLNAEYPEIEKQLREAGEAHLKQDTRKIQ